MAKYLKWDAASQQYKEITGLPDNLAGNDKRLLTYDNATGVWIAGLRITVGPTEPVGSVDGDLWFDTDAPVPESLKFFAQAEARSDSDPGFGTLAFVANTDTDLSLATPVTNTTMSYTNTSGVAQKPVFSASCSVTATLNGTQIFGIGQRIYVNGVLLVADGIAGTLGGNGRLTEKGSFVFPGTSIAPGATINVTSRVFYHMEGATAVGTGITGFTSAIRMWGGPL